MIKVLHTIDTTGPGGAETVFINLVKGLDATKFKSVVAIRGPGWVCDTLRGHGIEPAFVQSSGGFNFSYLKELIDIIREHKIDVIQAHLLGSSLYSSMAGLICRVPVISTIHGFVDTNEKERLMSLKTKIINLGSKKNVFVSNQLREYFVKNFGFVAEKSMTIYNGVDTTVFYPRKDDSIRREYGIGPEHTVVGAVGNIRSAKGYDIFLKAAKIIHEQHPESRFIVAGQGSGKLYDELIQLRRSLKLEEVFHFIGFQNDAAKVFNNFDIFVLPSISEGFSISTIEAMACGLPIVVTKSGGPEEILQNTKTNIITEKTSPIDIANNITKFITKINKKNLKIAIVDESCETKFSLKKMVSSYSLLYEELTNII
ncbi:glycosyl transferase, group 1 [Desulfuromonas soudanensis]|uniref:Glycosyl transferase, group 1 n=1 Tax=Desulfuromonas soudanensis TaxID=1603606 RepID=A0A0M4CXC2_9BACT|nr:glycosyltransferase [Desulfuromonas soudanensis]ALC16854.1 glycosyl transferase, group 1 [Desulfuromonas soudanensis]